jgi:hypothetical protein
MSTRLVPESATGFTDLFARITEEDDGYVVQIRLHNGGKRQADDSAWGEEVADSIESASAMIANLAARFRIPQDRIAIEIRMDDIAENTRH